MGGVGIGAVWGFVDVDVDGEGDGIEEVERWEGCAGGVAGVASRGQAAR